MRFILYRIFQFSVQNAIYDKFRLGFVLLKMGVIVDEYETRTNMLITLSLDCKTQIQLK
jgi:hypothetical protein